MMPFFLLFQNLLQSPGGFIVWMLMCIVLFFVIRELLTWYWKVNRIISLLEEIRDNTSGVPTKPAPSLRDGTLVRSDSLKQPMDLNLVLTVCGGLLLIAGLYMLITDEKGMAITSLAIAIFAFLPVVISNRKKAKVEEKSL